MSTLDAFSQRFAELLFSEFPTWREYARYDDTEGIPEGTLYLVVPNSVMKGKPLYIWTEENEVTVGWSSWHTHFGCWLGISIEEAYQQALGMIRDIMEERITIVMHTDQTGEVKYAGIYPCNEEPVDELAFHRAHPNLQLCIRSWRGTYDRSIES